MEGWSYVRVVGERGVPSAAMGQTGLPVGQAGFLLSSFLIGLFALETEWG